VVSSYRVSVLGTTLRFNFININVLIWFLFFFSIKNMFVLCFFFGIVQKQYG
jgi:hypothetical protein